MNSIKLTKVIFFLLLFVGLGVMAGGQADRAFDDRAMAEYAASKDFAYMSYVVQPPSIIDRIRWFFMELWQEFWRDPIKSRLTLWLFILVMFAIAAYYVIRMRFKHVLTAGTAGYGDAIDQLSIDDDRINYQELIEGALERQDFKSAIRYLYLNGLALLAKKERIRLAEWKTPYDYQLELTGKSVVPYAKLTLLFEYVWYGDFDVKRADFDKGRNYLELLQESIE
jgi:hypothetical protein